MSTPGNVSSLSGVSLDRLKERIVETQTAPVVPLTLFRGRPLRPGAARAYLNIVLAMMETNCKVIPGAHSIRHLCGLHYTSDGHRTLETFLSRLWLSPQTTDQIPHLRDYLESHPFRLHTLERVPPTSYTARTPWRVPLEPKPVQFKPAQPGVPSFYPFIVGEPQKEHDLIMAVDGIVPKGLPQSIREDLCQDLLVDVISGETTLDNLRENIRFRVRHAFKIHGWKYGVLSLDQPAYAGSSTTIGELLTA